jgi:uncharacterized protein (TIGR02246 family)
MTDDEQIGALFDQMRQAWTDGDAVAYGRCFTPDCDYVSFDGYRERGRDAMVASTTSCSAACCSAPRWSARWSRSATSATASP